MKRKTPLSIRIDPDLLAELDAWRESQPVTPSRTASIEAAIRRLTRFPDPAAVLREKILTRLAPP